MPVCKGDGSIEDGDVSGISGLGTSGNGAGAITDVWNGASCSLQASPSTTLRSDEQKLENDIITYVRS